jgi:hypothetical protein
METLDRLLQAAELGLDVLHGMQTMHDVTLLCMGCAQIGEELEKLVVSEMGDSDCASVLRQAEDLIRADAAGTLSARALP